MAEILCSIDTPNGNTVALMSDGTNFKTRVATLDSEIDIGEEDARTLYRTALSADGRVYRPFPQLRRRAEI